MRSDSVRLSKAVSYALRHHPEEFGLRLDKDGWVPVNDLLVALRQRHSSWQDLTPDDLAEMIARSEKPRFEMRDGRIRAFYGHSIAQKIHKTPSLPPAVLYHGTTPQASRTILQQGLKPMRRQYVHLSTDLATARRVALRRTSTPVILRIDARTAHQHGILFYPGNSQVWLADPIPPTFISEQTGA
ncbi:MAG: RNA 2'-phosphotransferase [Ktedonobacteraceae bacterium]|nr:RNA 2'-phosphotransferase [Ktedonobacteraceae bacterium]